MTWCILSRKRTSAINDVNRKQRMMNAMCKNIYIVRTKNLYIMYEYAIRVLKY